MLTLRICCELLLALFRNDFNFLTLLSALAIALALIQLTLARLTLRIRFCSFLPNRLRFRVALFAKEVQTKHVHQLIAIINRFAFLHLLIQPIMTTNAIKQRIKLNLDNSHIMCIGSLVQLINNRYMIYYICISIHHLTTDFVMQYNTHNQLI